MIKDYLNIILVEEDEGKRIFFENIFKDSKIAIRANVLHHIQSALQLLAEEDIPTPEILCISKDLTEKYASEFLSEIKGDIKFNDTILVIYSDNFKNEDKDEFLVNGANIVMELPDNYNDMKKIVNEIIAINWQYHTSGFNRNNFIMKL
ncbi:MULTISPECIES: response regulator [unclassified Chryseobacterium]|uniref:response regulator n=1 Tax=unclassified Chryseobacterium TaxID=2593645 RepID=UPI003017FB05